MLHGGKADLGADGGLARGVDDHVNVPGGADQLRVLRDRRLAGLEGRVEGGGSLGNGMPVFRVAGDAERLPCGIDVDLGDCRHCDAGHLPALGDDVRSHLAGTNQPDADGPSPFLQAASKIGSQPRGGPDAPVVLRHVECGHSGLPNKERNRILLC